MWLVWLDRHGLLLFLVAFADVVRAPKCNARWRASGTRTSSAGSSFADSALFVLAQVVGAAEL